MSGSKLDRGAADDGEITYAALVKAMRDGAAALIDVREPHEFHAGHVEGSALLPMSAFDLGKLPRDKPIVLICRSGNRSLTALLRARAAGFNDICHYRGGVLGWAREGGELV